MITLKNFLDPSSPDNLPIALLLAPDDIDYGNVESDGGDLRFYDDLPDDSPGIPYEIQTWDPDAYTVIWLAMPSLGAGESRDIYMYYDNPDPGPEPSSPWGDYNHVLHFEGDFDDARADASSLVEQGMVTFQPGAITQAIASAGDLPFVRLEGLGGGSQGGYISLMIRANSPAAVQDILYLTGDGGEYAKLILSSSKLSFRMSSEAPLGYAQAQHPVPLNADVWTHVALSWEDVADKPALTLMVNGMAAVSGMDKLKEFQFNDDQVLMASGTGDEYIYNFSGAIDELRFDGGPKDPEFAAFEAAANFPDFFVEGIGVEEQY